MHPRAFGNLKMCLSKKLTVRQLGIQPYQSTLNAMHHFTKTRTAETVDEIWLLEHPPTFTLGLTGNKKDIFFSNNIPVIKSDRGGQVTYHGLGQITAYVLIDLKRKNLSIRGLVTRLEHIIIDALVHWKISASTQTGHPGVYINNEKVASIGLRVKNCCSYHGFSLNVDMDLTPWQQISPCGQNVNMTQIADQVKDKVSLSLISEVLLQKFQQNLHFRYLKTIQSTHNHYA